MKFYEIIYFLSFFVLESIPFGVVFFILCTGFLALACYVWHIVNLFYKELKSKYVLTLHNSLTNVNNEIEGVSMSIINEEEPDT